MNFKREKTNDFYLHDTVIENIFLMEYMPGADSEALKVYLTALMYANTSEMSNILIARHLGIAEEDVLRAWNYWEGCGVIRKIYNDPEDRFHYTVQFLNMKDRLYGSAGEIAESSKKSMSGLPEDMDDHLLKELFESVQQITGRMFEGSEAQKIVSWIYDDKLSPQLILYAYQYSMKRGKNNFKYISKVLENWIGEGLFTVEAVKESLSENDERYHRYKRVMKALGFHRSATEAEQHKIDSWFDSMGFGMDKVLEACAKTSGISNPNINYVNSILSGWATGTVKPTGTVSQKSGKSGIMAQVRKQYEDTRKKYAAELEAHRKELYSRLPHMRELESEERKTLQSLSRLALSGGYAGRNSAADLKSRMNVLTEEKLRTLRELGYPEDYLERKYDCNICKDTGVLDNGERCRCFNEKLKQFLE